MEAGADPSLLCRLCMSVIERNEHVPIDIRDPSAEDFVDKIHKTFSMDFLTPATNWPNRVCGKCVAFVQQISDFHELILANRNEILQKFGEPFQDDDLEEARRKDQQEVEYFEEDIVEEYPSQDEEQVVIIEDYEKEFPSVPLAIQEEEAPPAETKLKRKRNSNEPQAPPSLRKSRKTTDYYPKREVSNVPKRPPKEDQTEVQDLDQVLRDVPGLLKCDLCNEMNFHTMMDVRNHFQSAHNVPMYVKCCGFRFDRRSKLADHVQRHSTPQAFLCDECPKAYATRFGLQLHKDNIHIPDAEKKFICDICEKRFGNLQMLRTHKHMQHSEKKFKCPECEKRFVNNCQRQQHITLRHANVRAFVCEICASAFKTKQAMASHRDTHFDMPRVKCEDCGKLYKNQAQLKKHIGRAHSDVEKVFECPHCQFRPKNRGALRSHILLIHKMDPNKFKCEVCGKGSKTTVRLREHMAGHTGEKLYTCNFCDQEFNSNANRYKHQKQRHPVEYEQMRQDREKKMYTDEGE